MVIHAGEDSYQISDGYRAVAFAKMTEDLTSL